MSEVDGALVMPGQAESHASQSSIEGRPYDGLEAPAEAHTLSYKLYQPCTVKMERDCYEQKTQVMPTSAGICGRRLTLMLERTGRQSKGLI